MLQFVIGFIVAMVGICFISFSETGIRLSFSGDVLALCAALVMGLLFSLYDAH